MKGVFGVVGVLVSSIYLFVGRCNEEGGRGRVLVFVFVSRFLFWS